RYSIGSRHKLSSELRPDPEGGAGGTLSVVPLSLQASGPARRPTRIHRRQAVPERETRVHREDRSEQEIELTHGQRALWFLDRLAPGTPAYAIAGAARVRGLLSIPALLRAARGLAARHPALRATFHEGPAGPRQRIAPEPRLDWREI